MERNRDLRKMNAASMRCDDYTDHEISESFSTRCLSLFVKMSNCAIIHLRGSGINTMPRRYLIIKKSFESAPRRRVCRTEGTARRVQFDSSQNPSRDEGYSVLPTLATDWGENRLCVADFALSHYCPKSHRSRDTASLS